MSPSEPNNGDDRASSQSIGRTSPRPSRSGDAIRKVIDGDLCVGCGLCTRISPEFKLRETSNGFLKVTARPDSQELLKRASAVCPFADAPDEQQIALARFPTAPHHDADLGAYAELFAGYSKAHRSEAGSGGLTRWLLARLLEIGEVDFVVTVDRKLAGEHGDLFWVGIHRSPEELFAHTSTSAYFPISLADALAAIDGLDGRFAITALPCFARALRAYAIADPAFAAKLAFVSGTICGGLKSRRYADYLALQMGVPVGGLDRINFRGKSLSRKANEKCVEVWREGNATDAPDAVARVQQLRGTDYGSGYFKPKACDYCDDVFAETADISFGDAWIEPYRDSPHGTNVVVVRHPRLLELLRSGVEADEIVLDQISADQARATQGSGLRHRRQGLSVRLWFDRLTGRWAPRKRVDPGLGSAAFVASQAVRIAIRKVSSTTALKLTSPLFHRTTGALVKLHGLLRPKASLPQRRGLGELRNPWDQSAARSTGEKNGSVS